MRLYPGQSTLPSAPGMFSKIVLLSALCLAGPACASGPESRPEPVPATDSAPAASLDIEEVPVVGAVESVPRATPRLPPDPEAPEDADDPHTTAEPAGERFYLKPFHSIIQQHREVGTHIDGPRCPMYPSCGAYADRIIREGGVYGLILFIDRLFYREFGRLSDRYMVAPRALSKSPRYYDPVSDVLPDDPRREGHRPSFFREDFRN